MKWVRYNQSYPQRYAFKRDVPTCWQHWAIKVRFRWETVWIVRDESGNVYMPDGGWALVYCDGSEETVRTNDLEKAAIDWGNWFSIVSGIQSVAKKRFVAANSIPE